MNTYKITAYTNRGGARATVRTVEIRASKPSVAVMRALNANSHRHPVLATNGISMLKGETLELNIERKA